MMDQLENLLSLPMETLVLLVAGYLGYRIAYVGQDQTHKFLDVAFITLAFALVARVAIDAWAETDWPEWGAMIAGPVASLVAASLWRSFFSDWTFWLLKELGVSTSDRYVSAWDTMRLSKPGPTNIVVRKKDGSTVVSASMYDFNDLKPGPVVYGADGSIGLYITHFRRKPGGELEAEDVFDPQDGYALTFIPAIEISDITIYHSPSV